MKVEGAVIEPQILNPSYEPDILFVENRGPLHGGTVQYLANAAMTNLGVDWIGADFVPHHTAMAAGSILRDEAFVIR
jgi:hypothetical protein